MKRTSEDWNHDAVPLLTALAALLLLDRSTGLCGAGQGGAAAHNSGDAGRDAGGHGEHAVLQVLPDALRRHPRHRKLQGEPPAAQATNRTPLVSEGRWPSNF